MNDEQLKTEIVEALWAVTDRVSEIQSATLTGSFAKSKNLDGLSDIDFVVVVNELTQATFEMVKHEYAAAIQPILKSAGYDFKLNSTFGPLKFNRDRLAVLHLMIYSNPGHRDHVIASPFTCLDWQESGIHRKASLADVFPTFALQPHHFMSARRSIKDYLNDFRKRVVSYRKLEFEREVPRESRLEKAMDERDRHEFAYHVMRFLMLNLLKLVRASRSSRQDIKSLLDRYFQVFPSGEENSRSLLCELADKKKRIDFASPIPNLGSRLETFVEQFEQQFTREFYENASRHVFFRHAPTGLNSKPLRFQGRSDTAILPLSEAYQRKASILRDLSESSSIARVVSSPLKRCLQSLEALDSDLTEIQVDARLLEIDYGACEAQSVVDCHAEYPGLFERWSRGEDPCFPPNGECTTDVQARVGEYCAEQLTSQHENTMVCTHNVVLRCLIGESFGVPQRQWHLLNIPHMTPIRLVSTERFGMFVELEQDVQREIFANFGVRNAAPVQRMPTEERAA